MVLTNHNYGSNRSTIISAHADKECAQLKKFLEITNFLHFETVEVERGDNPPDLSDSIIEKMRSVSIDFTKILIPRDEIRIDGVFRVEIRNGILDGMKWLTHHVAFELAHR